MPQYKVKELSLIGNELHQAGAIVEYAGLPAENLEPLDDEGRAKYQEYLDSNAARVKKMRDLNSESAVGDPADFAKAITAAISAGIAAGMAQVAAIPAEVPAPKGKAKDSLV